MEFEDINEIFEWDLKKLWKAYQQIKEEESMHLGQETQMIKHGIRVKIPIYYIINEWYEEFPSNKRVKIEGFGKLSIEDFYDEIEERERLIRQVIIDDYERGNPIEPRGK